jgi:hypothetical protein
MSSSITIPGWLVIVLALGLPLVTLAGRTWIVAWLEGKVKSTFDRQLATHKNELQLVTEATRFDYQRRIQDFSLFTERKHAVNARLYRYLLEAEGQAAAILPKGGSLTPLPLPTSMRRI